MLGFVNSFVEKELQRAIGQIRKHGIAEPCLLDIGCGRQPYRKLIENMGYAYASMDVAARDVKLDFQVALDDPLLPTMVPAGGYHLLLLTEVLEHVDDQRTAWANLRHLAAADSIVILTTPFLYPLHEEPWDACRPTHYQIRRFAERSGFTISKCETAGGPSAILGLFLSSVQRPRTKNPLKKTLVFFIWACCRGASLVFWKFPLLDIMNSKFYVTNLVVCERQSKSSRSG